MKNKIKILHLIKSLGRGGAEKLIPETALVHNQDKFEFHCLYFYQQEKNIVDELEAAGIQVHLIPSGNLGLFFQVSKVRAFAKELGIDIIHAHLPWAGIMARFVGNKLNIPIVYTEHNTWDRYNRVSYWGNRMSFKNQDIAIAVSNEVALSMQLNSMIDPYQRGGRMKIKVIQNGVNTEVFRRLSSLRADERSEAISTIGIENKRGESERGESERGENRRIESGRIESGRIESGRKESEIIGNGEIGNRELGNGEIENERGENERGENRRIGNEEIGNGEIGNEEIESERDENRRIESERGENRRIESEREEIKRNGESPNLPISQSPNLLNSKSPNLPISQSPNLPKSSKIIGIVAVFRDQKRLWIWIDLALKILQKCPDTHFLLVGDGEWRTRLEKQIEESGKSANFHLVGVQKKVIPFLSSMDIYLSTSEFEGLPIAMLEAMACEVPVVATRAGGIGEVVQHGIQGFLSEIDEYEALVAYCVQLITDSALHKSMCLAARERVVAQFSMKRMVEELEEVYEGVIGKESGKE